MTRMEVKTAVEKKGTNIAVLGVTTTSGEYIQFSKEQPGKIRVNTIEGRTFEKQELVSIPLSEIKYIHIQEADVLMNFLIVAGVLGIALVVVMIITMASID